MAVLYKDIKRHSKCSEVCERGDYKGYKYEIVSCGTHPCAYVEIPRRHRLFNVQYMDMKENIEVHGGITYSRDKYENLSWWIGWDYAHAGDYTSAFAQRPNNFQKKWQLSEIREEVFKVINQLKLMELSDLVMFQKTLIDQQRIKISKLESEEDEAIVAVDIGFWNKDGKYKEDIQKMPESELFRDMVHATFSGEEINRLRHFVIACNPRRINRLGKYLVACNDISPKEFLGKDLLEKVYKFYEKVEGVNYAR